MPPKASVSFSLSLSASAKAPKRPAEEDDEWEEDVKEEEEEERVEEEEVEEGEGEGEDTEEDAEEGAEGDAYCWDPTELSSLPMANVPDHPWRVYNERTDVEYASKSPHMAIAQGLPDARMHEFVKRTMTRPWCLIACNVFGVSDAEEVWPTQTDVWCSWCAHPFSTTPLPVCSKLSNRTAQVTAVACQASCALARVHADFGSHPELADVIRCNKEVWVSAFGLSPQFVAELLPSPPAHHVLQGFNKRGLTIEMYRDARGIVRQAPLTMYPFVTSTKMMEMHWDSVLLQLYRDLLAGRETSVSEETREMMEGSCAGAVVMDPVTRRRMVTGAERLACMVESVRGIRRVEGAPPILEPNTRELRAFEGDPVMHRKFHEALDKLKTFMQRMERRRAKADQDKDFERGLALTEAMIRRLEGLAVEGMGGEKEMEGEEEASG
jgi:hypothetical protein